MAVQFIAMVSLGKGLDHNVLGSVPSLSLCFDVIAPFYSCFVSYLCITGIHRDKNIYTCEPQYGTLKISSSVLHSWYMLSMLKALVDESENGTVFASYLAINVNFGPLLHLCIVDGDLLIAMSITASI